MTKTNRRTFIKAAGASAAATLISGMPSGWVGGAYAQDGPEVRTLRFGIIALTDCAPIVMAHELGYFKKFGISSVISKEASWAVIRDKLSIGFGGVWAAKEGLPLADYDEAPVAEHLKGREIDIAIDLGLGDGRATVWTCDLTHGYISINADYRS